MLNYRKENKASMAMDMPHKRAGVDTGIGRRLMAETKVWCLSRWRSHSRTEGVVEDKEKATVAERG